MLCTNCSARKCAVILFIIVKKKPSSSPAAAVSPAGSDSGNKEPDSLIYNQDGLQSDTSAKPMPGVSDANVLDQQSSLVVSQESSSPSPNRLSELRMAIKNLAANYAKTEQNPDLEDSQPDVFSDAVSSEVAEEPREPRRKRKRKRSKAVKDTSPSEEHSEAVDDGQTVRLASPRLRFLNDENDKSLQTQEACDTRCRAGVRRFTLFHRATL